jgi:predicted DNA-binding transcriptional regulator AlpA
MEFISVNDVLKKLKISKSYLNRLRKNDDSFPKAVKLSERRNTVFCLEEIEDWMSQKIYKQLNLFDHHSIIL